MQASFWKTVSVVGVIGIGSLVTLEVQNRLSRPDSVADTSTDAALKNLVIQSGEESLTAATTKSEFDLAMESSHVDTQGFNVTEPPLDTSLASADGHFHSESMPPQGFTPSVDTTVRSEQIGVEGNPFTEAQLQVTPAVAAQFEGSDQSVVEPVGLVGEPEFTADTASIASSQAAEAGVQPMALRPTPNVAEEAPASTSFPLFGAATDLQGAPDSQPAATSQQTADLPVPAPRKSDPFLFFGEKQNTTTTTPPTGSVTPPQTVQTQPGTTAPFYGSDEPQLKHAPADEQPRSLSNDVPMFDLTPENQPFGGQPEPAASIDQEDNPFPGLPASTQPEAIESGNSRRPFTSDLVPTPREPSSNSAPAFTSDPGESSDFPSSIPVDSVPLTTPSSNDAALPFAEDLPSTGDLQTVPELPATSPLMNPSFPQPESTYSETDIRLPNSRYPESPDRAGNSPAGRPVDSLDIRPSPRPGQFEETPPLTSPGLSELRPRTFNAQPPAAIPGRESARDGIRQIPQQNSDTDVRVISAVMRPNLVLQKTVRQTHLLVHRWITASLFAMKVMPPRLRSLWKMKSPAAWK